VAQSACTNCVITSALAVLLCRRGCDANRVIADFAFFPPTPPTYVAKRAAADTDDDTQKDKDREKDQTTTTSSSSSTTKKGKKKRRQRPPAAPLFSSSAEVRSIEWKYRDLERNPTFARFRVVDGRDGRPACRLLVTSRKQVIPSFFFDCAHSLRTTSFCVIYFHANATDCGAMLPTYAALRARLGVAVLAVEYTGYGGSTGSPSVADTFADADAAYQEATERLGFAPDKVVLYGQSVGSGPACHLAARRRCAGLILHSPIASGIRSLTGGGCCSPIYVFACLDPFHNLRELQKVDCPVFVIHGTHDEEIPLAHGHMLHDAAKSKHEPFWVQGAGHNNVLETKEEDYFAKLHAFLQRLVVVKKSANELQALAMPVAHKGGKGGKGGKGVVKARKTRTTYAKATTRGRSPSEDDDDNDNGKATKNNNTGGKKRSLFHGWWRRLKSAQDEQKKMHSLSSSSSSSS